MHAGGRGFESPRLHQPNKIKAPSDFASPEEPQLEGVDLTLSMRVATEEDVPLLAKMNKQLIEDEGHRNPMSIVELSQRMQGWLQGGWNADVFFRANTEPRETVIGYALYQHRREEFVPDESVVYLRQFLILREYRGQGLGRLALRQLFKTRFPARCTVVVDVLTANERGLNFCDRRVFTPTR